MPTVHVSVVTPLEPAEVMQRLTDFGPGRAEAWANVEAGSVTVHEQGACWAYREARDALRDASQGAPS